MILYPAIEIAKGEAVSLNRGRIEEPVSWAVDPVAKALEFAHAGAEWLHLTDFDALDGDRRNVPLIEEVIHRAEVPVQLAGGFRSRERVARWIDRGAGRIVLGTLAALDPPAVRRLAERYPDQIVVAVDVWKGRVMVEGWRRAAAIAPEAFVEGYADCPLAGFLITDIDSDVSETEATLARITGLAGRTRLPVIASGIVRSLDDISRLKYVRNVAGAVVGRALAEGRFAFRDALRVARPEPERQAEFI